jgi:hypothetical protein
VAAHDSQASRSDLRVPGDPLCGGRPLEGSSPSGAHPSRGPVEGLGRGVRPAS